MAGGFFILSLRFFSAMRFPGWSEVDVYLDVLVVGDGSIRFRFRWFVRMTGKGEGFVQGGHEFAEVLFVEKQLVLLVVDYGLKFTSAYDFLTFSQGDKQFFLTVPFDVYVINAFTGFHRARKDNVLFSIIQHALVFFHNHSAN